jgi:hypothetical protein
MVTVMAKRVGVKRFEIVLERMKAAAGRLREG